MGNDWDDNQFYRIDGSNGAIFFFSTATWRDWLKSLQFYRAVSISAFAKKCLLQAAYPCAKQRSVLDSQTVAEKICTCLCLHSLPQLNANGSAMISPTRDKAVIHRHGVGYEKIAVGKSLPGVARELEVYQLLNQKSPQQFAYSQVEEAEKGTRDVHFLMNYAVGTFSENYPDLGCLVHPLAEFFQLAAISERPWEDQWRRLANEEPQLMERISKLDHKGGTPCGLVHRDFKPWNVKGGKKTLFFDFESVVFDGCPLEDLWNYDVDPLIRCHTPENVWKRIQTRTWTHALQLLQIMGLPSKEVFRYWCWYLLERNVFWSRHQQTELADKFLMLYDLSCK